MLGPPFLMGCILSFQPYLLENGIPLYGDARFVECSFHDLDKNLHNFEHQDNENLEQIQKLDTKMDKLLV